MLPPLFQILMGLSGFALIFVRFAAAKAFKPLWGKLVGVAIVCQMFGLFVFSYATGSRSIGAGAELFATGGGAMVVAVVLMGAAMVLAARKT